MIDAVIVTFNPDLAELKRCSQSILQLGGIDHVFIVDNGSSNADEIEHILQDTSISIVRLKKNLGIARALNVGFGLAKDRSAKWVLTSDQDSEFPSSFFDPKVVNSLPPEVSMVGCQIFDRAANILLTPRLSGEFAELDNCITSGSLTRIDSWSRIGGFDNNLFIDQVDFDFCYRLKQAGYKVLQNNAAVLSHEIGNLKVYGFGRGKILVFNHSAFRKYYIVRNIIYISKKRFHGVRLHAVLSIIKQYLLVLFFEHDKRQKIHKMTQGVLDGIRNRY